MSQYDARIETYIGQAADFAKPILSHLRDLVHDTCPDVQETWKWSFPNFYYCNTGLCSIAAFKHHCAFSFWKGAIMPDPDGILIITGKEAMGNLGKITSLQDLPSDAILKKYLKAAMHLNEIGAKVPRKKQTDEVRVELTVPTDFDTALRSSLQAIHYFEQFSYSHKKEYIEWIEEAKTIATRYKRIAQAIEWIMDGKSRNWKYNK
jgi:uncharacterized protein YdeI (YjbR/CyaY-like superfamily)